MSTRSRVRLWLAMATLAVASVVCWTFASFVSSGLRALTRVRIPPDLVDWWAGADHAEVGGAVLGVLALTGLWWLTGLESRRRKADGTKRPGARLGDPEPQAPSLDYHDTEA